MLKTRVKVKFALIIFLTVTALVFLDKMDASTYTTLVQWVFGTYAATHAATDMSALLKNKNKGDNDAE